MFSIILKLKGAITYGFFILQIQAFLKAWGELCRAAYEPNGVPTLVIPGTKAFLLQPIKFQGPCNSNGVHVQVTKLSNYYSYLIWVSYKKVTEFWGCFKLVLNLNNFACRYLNSRKTYKLVTPLVIPLIGLLNDDTTNIGSNFFS